MLLCKYFKDESQTISIGRKTTSSAKITKQPNVLPLSIHSKALYKTQFAIFVINQIGNIAH